MRLIDADALKELIDGGYDIDFSEVPETKRELLNMIDYQETQMRWIPVSERLPEDERRVLCTVQSGEHFYVVPCVWVQSVNKWLPEIHGNHDNVIAWMRLPEPYKGGTK